jgi:hypothetical protein
MPFSAKFSANALGACKMYFKNLSFIISKKFGAPQNLHNDQ